MLLLFLLAIIRILEGFMKGFWSGRDLVLILVQVKGILGFLRVNLLVFLVVFKTNVVVLMVIVVVVEAFNRTTIAMRNQFVCCVAKLVMLFRIATIDLQVLFWSFSVPKRSSSREFL